MFCTKCGNEISEGAKFCTGCGAPVKNEPTQVEPAANQAPEPQPNPAPAQQHEDYTISFFKKKAFTGMTYSKIQTDIAVTGDSITVTRTVGKKVQSSQTLAKSELQSATTHSSLEIWSIIAVILNIALVFATMEFKLLIPILFWLWFGYTKEIRIITTNGQKIAVPFEGLAGQGESAEQLLALCNK